MGPGSAEVSRHSQALMHPTGPTLRGAQVCGCVVKDLTARAARPAQVLSLWPVWVLARPSWGTAHLSHLCLLVVPILTCQRWVASSPSPRMRAHTVLPSPALLLLGSLYH